MINLCYAYVGRHTCLRDSWSLRRHFDLSPDELEITLLLLLCYFLEFHHFFFVIGFDCLHRFLVAGLHLHKLM